jgi:hypothetical protein
MDDGVGRRHRREGQRHGSGPAQDLERHLTLHRHQHTILAGLERVMRRRRCPPLEMHLVGLGGQGNESVEPDAGVGQD